MFSGIITNIQKPRSIDRKPDSMRLTFSVPKGWKISAGESININGVCTTVEKTNGKVFQVYYMAETLKKTNLGSTDKDYVFNFERCLTLRDLVGGHLLYGHVDTTARVLSVKKESESNTVFFQLLPGFTKYMVYKGSVAVNGVSLTVVSVSRNSFSVSLIPHTLKNTNLGDLKKGSIVNIEVDMLAKYIEKLLANKA